MLYNDDVLMNDGDNHSKKPENRPGGDQSKPQQNYQEGTTNSDDENDAKPNIPGPNEVPDQQKVGEDDDDQYHVET